MEEVRIIEDYYADLEDNIEIEMENSVLHVVSVKGKLSVYDGMVTDFEPDWDSESEVQFYSRQSWTNPQFEIKLEVAKTPWLMEAVEKAYNDSVHEHVVHQLKAYYYDDRYDVDGEDWV